MKVKLRICKAVARAAKRFLRPAMFACLLLLLFAAWSRDAQAQGTTGSITGTVTDATSAVIAGATVTITQLSTNEAHTATTSDIGTYSVTQLPPGTYNVKVEKGGFKGYEQKDIVLTIDRIAQVNAELQTGSEQQTVTVTGEAPEIQTEASSVGLVVDSQTIENTPLNGHTSIIGLLALAPGVQGAGAQDQIPVYGVTPSIGGTNAYGAIGFTLDGATNMEVTLQRGSAEVPPLDAIAEFKVITTGEPAEFNQPAQVIVVSRGAKTSCMAKRLSSTGPKALQPRIIFREPLPGRLMSAMNMALIYPGLS